MSTLNLEKLRSFANFCGDIWCEWHMITISEENVIHIVSDSSKWIIRLRDYDDFKNYILWHYDHNHENDKESYHRQRSYKSIYNAIACAYAHDFDKKYGIDFNPEDFKRLKKDFELFYRSKYEVEE